MSDEKVLVVPVIIGKEVFDGLTATSALSEVASKVFNAIGTNVRENGHLVAFPTETVYGLGANALDKNAVLRIFEAKARPLSDPVICHVSCWEEAERLYGRCSPLELSVLRTLASTFWPGPLSLVGPAAENVLPELTAGTSYVATRCPNNPIALALIRASRVPIAAPSANRFGHISPSCAAHVQKNFHQLQLKGPGAQRELLIMDGGSCQVGIESTVCKVAVEDGALRVTILRRGHVSKEMIDDALRAQLQPLASAAEWSLEEQKALQNLEVAVSNSIHYLIPKTVNHVTKDDTPHTTSEFPETTRAISKPDTGVHCSPGMLLTHYSPSVPTFLLRVETTQELVKSFKDSLDVAFGPSDSTFPLLAKRIPLKKCVVLDAFDVLAELRTAAGGYFSLAGNLLKANTGSQAQKTLSDDYVTALERHVFHALHLAEDAALKNGASAICIYDFGSEAVNLGEKALAVYDKVFRSASGRVASVVVRCPHPSH